MVHERFQRSRHLLAFLNRVDLLQALSRINLAKPNPKSNNIGLVTYLNHSHHIRNTLAFNSP